MHDTFKFLSLNLHVRAVSDIAIYTSRIELPNLHIQGHNCHFPEPSHLVAIQKNTSAAAILHYYDELFQLITFQRENPFFFLQLTLLKINKD